MRLQILAVLAVSASLPILAGAEIPPPASTSGGTTVVEHRTEGNLEITHQLECGAELRPEYTPPDLYAGVRKCVEQSEFEKAAAMFALAGAYGRVDIQRVADETAHQGLDILLSNSLSGVSDEGKKKFNEVITSTLVPGKPELASFCEAIKKVGPPTYFPRYMIQHGIKAFGPPQPNQGLVENFDIPAVWNTTLDTYLHCDTAKSGQETAAEDAGKAPAKGDSVKEGSAKEASVKQAELKEVPAKKSGIKAAVFDKATDSDEDADEEEDD